MRSASLATYPRRMPNAPSCVPTMLTTKLMPAAYDAGSGARLGQIKSHVRYAPFFVTGTLLVTTSGPELRQTAQGAVEEPLQIKAFDLTTGKLAWIQAIRDTANRLPPPP